MSDANKTIEDVRRRMMDDAERLAAEQAASRSVSDSRFRIVSSCDPAVAFYADAVLSLDQRFQHGVGTAYTDGWSVTWDPAFVCGLTPAEVDGVLMHEVLHVALRHHARRPDGCSVAAWNVAADLAINSVLVRNNIKLPECGLMPGRGAYADFPPDLSAEEYLDLLRKSGKEKEINEAAAAGGCGLDPGGCGGVVEPAEAGDPDGPTPHDGPASAGSKADAELAADRMAGHLEQAARRGTAPAGLERLIGAAKRPPEARWQDVLAEFLTRPARQDETWSRPNRRTAASGPYLPSVAGATLGRIDFLVDCSGSIGGELLEQFSAEVEAAVAPYDCTARFIYHDVGVHRVEDWRPEDGPPVLRPKGGGGTCHAAAFREAEGGDESGEPPAVIVALTDLETAFPERAPSAPVLWAVFGGCKTVPPFGEVIRVRG